MKVLLLPILLLALSLSVFAQKTADSLNRQIKSLKAEKNITISPAGSTTRIMGAAPSFDQKEARLAGIQAMNFGMAVFFAGTALAETPHTIDITFWVLTKKPRFEAGRDGVLVLDKEDLALGPAVWSSKPASNMEYLNFKVPRENISKLVSSSQQKIKLGNWLFTFTPEQVSLLRNFLAVTDAAD